MQTQRRGNTKRDHNRDTKILINKVPLLIDAKGQKIGIIGNYTDILDPAYYGKRDKTKKNIALTSRQADCLVQLALGKSAKQIANEFHISVRTVEHHIENIKNRLGCESKSELIKKAFSIDFIRATILTFY